MATVRPEILLIAGAAVIAGLLLVGKNAGAVGSGLGSAAVDMVDGVVSGAVIAIGEKVGVPRTSLEQGRADLANGNLWDASFNLPAGEFIAGAWDRLTN